MTKNHEEFINGLNEQNYYIIEEEIDVEIQNKYFKRSHQVDDDIAKDEVLDNVSLLSDSTISIEEKKTILTQLASLCDVESFRILEKQCRQFDNEELNIWSILAYNESKMTLNGALKNVKQIFISTGLGSKNGRFRYFCVLLPHEDLTKFSDFQREFITKELSFTLEQNASALEKTIEDTEDYISFKILIPFKANIPKLFTDVLNNCNQLAPFVNKHYIITNVNTMNNTEINDFKKDLNDDDDKLTMEDFVAMN